ncbi:MAG: DASS family sodium-coupled anion symporter [Halopseudomonas yangmingensis]
MSNTSATNAAPMVRTGIQRTGLWLGLLWLLACLLLPAPGEMSLTAWRALGLMLLMATWWSTEAIPIPATALLPIPLIPALDLGSVSQASSPYANPIIFLFMGGFVLGLAMQRWNLHRRIALATLLAVGSQPRRQIGGFMLATAFLSMWVSNTATTIMMLPIGLSVLSLLDGQNPEAVKRFATALLLAIAYAASVGGIATLIGTPPNALLAAWLAENQGIQVGFAQWMLIGVPVAASMLLLVWWWLTRKDFGLSAETDSQSLLRAQLHELGPMGVPEQRVALLFGLTALAWIVQPLLSGAGLAWLNDTLIAIAAALLLFILPAGNGRDTLMDWESAAKLPWGVLLLFGGGLSLAGVISSSGLAQWIASSLGSLQALPLVLMILLVVTVIIFLTEVTSNTATAAAFLPLLGALAIAQGVSPLLLTVPAAIAASCAFMMPVATPPNAIVFASGHLRIGQMISAGLALNIGGMALVTLISYTLVGLIFGL